MLTTLARASVDGAVFAAAIWAIARLTPRLSPSAKAVLWWLVSVKFLVALLWPAPIPLPLLPAGGAGPAVTAVPAVTNVTTPGAGPVGTGRPWHAATAIAALWSAGAAILFIAGWRQWRDIERAIACAGDAPETIQAMTREIAARLGVSRVPAVRLSDAVETPLVAGVLRPAIVVPADRFERLAADRQRMAVCHELAHIKRRDLWFGAAVAVAERLFFFHPLARLAAREYVFWREAACDAAVIEALGATPHDYGRLLLDLGVSAPRRTLAAAGAPWSFGNLKRRIVMLGRPSSASAASRLAAAAALTIATIGLVPLTLTARATPLAATAAPPPPVASAMAAAPAPAATDTADRDRQARTGAKPQHDDTAFVVFHADGEATMSGSSDDMTRARQLRHNGEAMLWFRREGTEYIVRDPAVMQDVREIWRRVSEIGSHQGVLGAEQGVLGAQQGALGVRQGELGAQQAALAAEQSAAFLREAELAQKERSSQTAADLAPLLRARADLVEKNVELRQLLRDLEAKMRGFQVPMEELARQMTTLSKEMDALGEKMTAATAEAEAKMRELLDRAIASGLAQIVR